MQNHKRILFVIPDYVNIWENLGMAYIAAYAKKHFDADYKCVHQRFDDKNKILAEGSVADIVAFTATSPTYLRAVELAREIKKRNPEVKIVIGGHHVSAVSEYDDAFDFVVKGEGEKAFLGILQGREDGIIQGEKIQWDELPWADRDFVFGEKMVGLCEDMCGERITSFQSKRVCPFRCRMCGEKKITGVCGQDNPVRVRDPKDLLDEIEHYSKKYNLTMFKFVDATWDTSEKDVIEFCQEKIKRANKLKWEVMIHAALMTEEMMKWMSLANCWQINVGVESGSQKVLNFIGKGTTPDKVAQVFEWGRKCNIQRRGFFMLGVPNETTEDIRMTEALVDKIEPDVFGITILCPYPGSDLYRDEFKNVDWSKADEYSNNFWYTETFTNQELKKWQAYFVQKYKKNVCWHQKIYADNT